MNFTTIALLIQLVFGVIIGMYFWNLLKNQRSQKVTVDRESKKEMEQLRRLRALSLSEPLSEKVRPSQLHEVIGQKEGVKALKAALCGENPQHVLIYGPPGVGKTAAARLVLEAAKKNSLSPFKQDAAFVEMDGATSRFDDRGIADPLIGSVHDPIYQGAGAMGQAGIPQPKQGAVTKAHGGMLFIDEIGELHSIQLNKLLKVLEDRKVYLDSAYYSEENRQIPVHIHDIFQNGLPADFRLVGATTRKPEELPAALRSRCMEIYFRGLDADEIKTIAKDAAKKSRIVLSEEAADLVAKYAHNGREAVNTVQIAAGVAAEENKKEITKDVIEWVVTQSRLSPRLEKQVREKPQVGVVNGLAVTGAGNGMLIEIEATAKKVKSQGEVTVTGIVEEENHGSATYSMKRKSLAKSSVENVVTVLQSFHLPVKEYDIHVNFPGGIPIDGPSAGAAMALAIYSSIKRFKVSEKVAVTGELGIHGDIKPVGGVAAKVDAAVKAGATHVFVPIDNDQQSFHMYEGVTVQPLKRMEELLKEALLVDEKEEWKEPVLPLHEAPVSPASLS
ncbi:Lon-like ATP-dependent protease [Alteribacillus persepolensis]|uniref:endopeptidase La n=1 Tax=Alteribacillus persepolensis TaxID=568899 RepID=A0A1G8BRB6_9BACI|nr:ATP-dependent protease LonB [Alteribacillus persepolensis]SDH35648.1 Lon-like ATP-dependent protease [Alteribacillus persepolensis]